MRNEMFFGAALCLTPFSAYAHVTLVEPSALPGAHYVAHFRVGHGCSGSPTVALSIAIPDGVSNVRPEPKPGWALEATKAGSRTNSVTWKGGNLAADAPGVFAVAMTLPGTPGTLAFPATQICEKGVVTWSELSAADGHRPKNPAPLLTVSPTLVAPPNNSMPGMKM